MPNDDYIKRSDALKAILGLSIYDTIEELEGARTIAENTWADGLWDAYKIIEEEVDAADVVEEENILKFYYVRSIDEYWIGQRVDNFYYAEYDSKTRQWVWTHSRYLPWGEHIISTTSLWKEHTYPSKPEEIPFADWLQGFIRKHIAADVEPKRKTGRWIIAGAFDDFYQCPECGEMWPIFSTIEWKCCPICECKIITNRPKGEENAEEQTT